MKGFKEIAAATIIGVASVGAIRYLTNETSLADRDTKLSPAPTRIQQITDDPALSLTWGLDDVHAPDAWALQTGRKEIVVAVIDTGCDINHPDLQNNIWTNPGETGMDENGNNKATNGLDDDGNGFVDDVHGWNFASNDADVKDKHGHGTHIAGIIGAVRGNGIGSSGLAPDVSLMILKYYDAKNSGPQNLRYTIAALRYAVKMGAKIINYSGGGILKSRLEQEALDWAASQGVLVVAAAGNEGLNSDFFHFYPADYDLPNIISVTAIDRDDQLLYGSNFGRKTVDIAAPGKNIFSTLPGGYGYMSGTSQATAFVTGLAALLMAQDERFTQPPALIGHVMAHGRAIASLKGKTVSGMTIDAGKALVHTLDLPLSTELAEIPQNGGRAPSQVEKTN